MKFYKLAIIFIIGLCIYAAPGQAKQNKDSIQINAINTVMVDDKPLLHWLATPDAVMYEIEFLGSKPENNNDTEPSKYRIFASREVYSNAYHVDLSWYMKDIVYWRVKALDYHGNPISVFSNVQELKINHNLQKKLKPESDAVFNQDNIPTPLYPVYSWIRIPGATQYEVEITSHYPENPNDIKASKYRIWSKVVGDVFDCYDDEPRNIPGTYFWRVRGLDEHGEALGVYSDARQFVVSLAAGSYSASFGDSIVHGGGSVSYSPADLEYDFEPYLNFPNLNLGRSGDTTLDLVKRFEQDVLPFHPQFLLILGGSNSLRGPVSAEQVISELAMLREKCLASNIRPIFLTLPSINPVAIKEVFDQDTASDWRKKFTMVNEFIREQDYFIDLEPHFINKNGILLYKYAIDGLHPGLLGKQKMANIINENWSRVTD